MEHLLQKISLKMPKEVNNDFWMKDNKNKFLNNTCEPSKRTVWIEKDVMSFLTRARGHGNNGCFSVLLLYAYDPHAWTTYILSPAIKGIHEEYI